ncbi:MAG: LCP family protein [Lachnospiraceae bacterium]
MASRRRRRGSRRRKPGNWFTRLSTGKRIGVCIGGVFVCLLASTVVFVAAKLGKLETKKIPKEDIVVNELEEEVGEGYTNIALFGGDSRTGELEKGVRTDCIIVASLNNATKEIKMVSVYRDTLLNLSEGTLQKCNAAYSYGGPEQAINMLNMNLDLDIQNYVTVDFSVLVDVIDLLGGIEIDVKEEEIKYINKFLGETAEVAGTAAETPFIEVAGLQTLTGTQAVTYSRIRSTAGGDFTRTERQRTVIEKMVEKIKKTNLMTINKILDKVFPKMSTSFSLTEMLNYAKSYAKYVLGANLGFPIDKATDNVPGLGSIVVPVTLESNVQKLHEFLYADVAYTPSSKVSEISRSIQTKVGNKKAEDDDALRQKKYEEKDNSSQESNRSTNETTGGNNAGTEHTDNGNTQGNNENQNGNQNEGSGDAPTNPAPPENGGATE